MSTTSSTESHRIDWKFKLALVLAFLPFMNLFVALIMHWPLPTFLVNFLTGERANYIFYMAHTKENVLGSVTFAIGCFAIGLAIIFYLVYERGSQRAADQDFFHSLFNLSHGENPDTPKPDPPVLAQHHDENIARDSICTVLRKKSSNEYTIPETTL